MSVSECGQKNVRVTVDGTEIPTVDSSAERDQIAVEVQVRKDGPGAITRLSDVYFPSVWRGENIFESLPFGDDVEAVPVIIEARPPSGARESGDDDSWQIIHDAFLRRIGSDGSGRLLRMRVDDYSKILQNTFVSDNFEGNTMLSEAASRVTSQLQSKGIDMGVSTHYIGDQPEGRLRPAQEAIRTDRSYKNFESNKHTLADVLDWIASNQENALWYVDDRGDSIAPEIVIGRNIHPEWNDGGEFSDDGNAVTIRKNLALQDINPINAVSVRGDKGAKINLFGRTIVSFGDTYPIAQATHDKLFKAAGGTGTMKTVHAEGVHTQEQAAKKAKKLLRERLSGAGESSMVLNGRPDMIPWGAIYARPACGDLIGTGERIPYSTERVTHRIPATGLYTTEVATGIKVFPEDISVSTWSSEGQGTESSADTYQGIRDPQTRRDILESDNE